jgi:hypothetical protein
MCCDALAAREAGDAIEFMNLRDAGIKYPMHFAQSEDETTWVSIVDTEGRVQL